MVESVEPSIHVVSTSDVRPLRREVLRVDMPDATVDFDGDDHPETFHLAVRDAAGNIIAVSTWMLRPLLEDPAVRSIQLRGMATRQGFQGMGLGGLLIEAGIEQSRRRAITWIWANARDSALPFYQRHGFEVFGEGFIESVTQLPHHRVRRTI